MTIINGPSDRMAPPSGKQQSLNPVNCMSAVYLISKNSLHVGEHLKNTSVTSKRARPPGY